MHKNLTSKNLPNEIFLPCKNCGKSDCPSDEPLFTDKNLQSLDLHNFSGKLWTINRKNIETYFLFYHNPGTSLYICPKSSWGGNGAQYPYVSGISFSEVWNNAISEFSNLSKFGKISA